MGDRAGEGATLNNIAFVYDRQGRYQEVLETYEQALVIAREVGDRAVEGTTLNNIAAVYHNQGRYQEAMEQIKEELRGLSMDVLRFFLFFVDEGGSGQEGLFELREKRNTRVKNWLENKISRVKDKEIQNSLRCATSVFKHAKRW
jgi:tetratricopeptide (TPR) repeat protein